MARRFIAGKNPKDAIVALMKLHDAGFSFTVDLLGEKTLSDIEADEYMERYVDLIETLARRTNAWRKGAQADRNHLGAAPQANVSLKLSALEPFLDPVDPEGSVRRIRRRVMPILQRAQQEDVFVNFDLEQWDHHDITLSVFEELLRDTQLRDWPHAGIVVQAYARSAKIDIERLLALARDRRTPITVRLVKGAYWDYELVRASQFGYPLPVFENKVETDANFERLAIQLLDNVEYLLPAFGSHNLRLIAYAISVARDRGIPDSAYEIQMLHGMAEPLRAALLAMGFHVRVYTPVGERIPGMAYLVRRLLENTSNQGFLRQTYHEDADHATLLAKPETGRSFPLEASIDKPRPFDCCAHLDFSDQGARGSFAESVERIPTDFPIPVPVIINEVEGRGSRTLERVYPGDLSKAVANVELATIAQANAAVDSAAKAWPEWRDKPLAERTTLLKRLAERLESDRNRLAALQVWEVGKPWREADADVAEAVDFCRYYAHRAPEELGPQKQGDALGETNEVYYEGRGVAAVVAPWNFPLAILCGMTTTNLVAGNTVVVKPAEQSSATALAFFRHLLASGIPSNVVHFVPGVGEEVGYCLVQHPHVVQIAFTGSKRVGLAILEAAGAVTPEQRRIKRVVCEMGGKNAIIIDEDADLDEAVAGVAQSAFGYAGQKCSACSKVLIVGDAYEPFMARFKQACLSLIIAPPHLPECQVPPVIDTQAQRRLTALLEDPGNDASLIYRGKAPENACFVPPAVFAVEDSHHSLMQDELFGPIVAVMHVNSFSQALDIANKTEFALTGGVFSRLPTHLREAKARFNVGNLYLNRAITGATVGRQPFGGFQMSGIGTKAGARIPSSFCRPPMRNRKYYASRIFTGHQCINNTKYTHGQLAARSTQFRPVVFA